MNKTKRNAILSMLAQAMHSLAVLCSTGTVMQMFLSNIGFSPRHVYLLTTIAQAANIATIFLCSQWADRGHLIKQTILAEIPQGILYLFFIPLCLWQSTSLTSFLLLTGICALQAVGGALYTVCNYKLPYYIYKADSYGSILALLGLFGSLLSLFTGVLISWLNSFLSYSQMMLYACGVSALLMFLSVLFHLGYKPVVPLPTQAASQKSEKNVFPLITLMRYSIFRKFILSNTFRGFGYGLTTVMATIALTLGYDTQVSTMVISVQSAAVIVGCIVFGFISKRIPLQLIILAGSLAFVSMPLLMTGNEYIFYAAFAVTIFGRTIVEHSVPSLFRYCVPAEIAGTFNGWRMLLFYAGSLSATAIATVLPIRWVLIIAVATQIFVGIDFYISKELRNPVNS